VEPSAERDRVNKKYARKSRWYYALWIGCMTATVVATIAAHRSWAFALGAALAFAGTEYRNFRLRENARRFADPSSLRGPGGQEASGAS